MLAGFVSTPGFFPLEIPEEDIPVCVVGAKRGRPRRLHDDIRLHVGC